MRTRALAVIVVGSFLMHAHVGAQSAVAPPAAPQATQQPAPIQQPTFKSSVALVQVDAIVKDGKGRFVPDLTAADFEVREDGVLQRVEQIYVVVERDGRSVALPAGTAEPAQPGSLAASSAPALPPQAIQRTFVLVFDNDNTLLGGISRARDAALQFLAANFRTGDIGGVVSNAKMANNRLTMDRAELEAAVKAVTPTGDARSSQLDMRDWPRLLDAYEVYLITQENREAIARAASRACADDPDGCRSGVPADQIVKEKAFRLLPQLRAHGQQAMRTVRAVAAGLRRLPGRKTVILMTDGFFAEDEWANLREITDEANRSLVRIYALDTRGLNRGSASSDIIDMGPHSPVTPASDLPGSTTGFDTGSDGPNSLAVDTGGVAIRNENNFAKALSDIASDTSNYYVLGYRSTNEKLDGKFRKIAVRVRKTGFTARARQGYLATPDLASPSPEPTAAVAAPATPPPAELPVAPPLPAGAAIPAASPSPPAVVPPAGDTPAVRLRPDVNDRVATLGKVAPPKDQGSAAALSRARAGWDAYQKGDVRGAKAALSQAAADPAAPPWVHYTLGWSEFALGEHAAAANDWERVRSAVPGFESVYFDLADAYLQQREFGRALEVLRVAEQRWKDDVEVYNAIGSIQAARGALNEAIATFEKGVSLGPANATACYNLAKASELRYVESQRFHDVSRTVSTYQDDKARAIAYYQRTIDLGKEFVEEARAGLKRLGSQ